MKSNIYMFEELSEVKYRYHLYIGSFIFLGLTNIESKSSNVKGQIRGFEYQYSTKRTCVALSPVISRESSQT